LVHENLYRAGNFAGISLAAHVESLCTHLFRSFGAASGRITLDAQIEDVALDLDRAIPCGLIINELVCNSLKHAFPGGRAGRVVVKFYLSSEKWYTLVVGDNGVGLPTELDPGHSDSTGLQLVSDLTEQLDGTLTVDRTDGTTFNLRFHAGPRGGP
jgi:two-component sensor histidine kinase